MADGSDDYEVGYANPPRHTRWQKGQSGNPRGRRKAARGLKTDLREELASKMDIRMNGQKVSGTRQQLMLRMLNRAGRLGRCAGDQAADRSRDAGVRPEDHTVGGKRLSAQDQAILDELLARKTPVQSVSPSPTPSPTPPDAHGDPDNSQIHEDQR